MAFTGDDLAAFRTLLKTAEIASEGDSNDDEISALWEALDEACRLLQVSGS